MSVTKKATIFSIRLFIIILILLIPLISIFISGFLITKYIRKTENISFDKQKSKSIQEINQKDLKSKAQELINQTFSLFSKEDNLFQGKERINILLLGKASEDYPGSELTDTIILASFKPKTNQAALLSIPRDLYVKIPNTNQYTKINYIYNYGLKKGGAKKGVEYIQTTIKEVTNQEIDYYLIIDFKGFEKFINEIGGVKINVNQDIYDDKFPGPNYSYQTFEIKAGNQQLDGETALKYVRTRHNPDGDFGRAYRQQQVLEAIKNKIFSWEATTLIPKTSSIYDIVKENIETNIDSSQYPDFLKIAKKINVHNTTNKVIDNRGDNPILANYHARLGRKTAYFLRPVSGDFSRIHEVAENIFDLEKLQKLNEKRDKENPSIVIINKSGDHSFLNKAKEKLSQAGFKNIYAQNSNEKIKITTTFDNCEGSKPYSFDTIIKTLDSQAINGSYSNHHNYDFVIVLGENIKEMDEKINGNITLPENAYDYLQ